MAGRFCSQPRPMRCFRLFALGVSLCYNFSVCHYMHITSTINKSQKGTYMRGAFLVFTFVFLCYNKDKRCFIPIDTAKYRCYTGGRNKALPPVHLGGSCYKNKNGKEVKHGCI